MYMHVAGRAALHDMVGGADKRHASARAQTHVEITLMIPYPTINIIDYRHNTYTEVHIIAISLAGIAFSVSNSCLDSLHDSFLPV